VGFKNSLDVIGTVGNPRAQVLLVGKITRAFMFLRLLVALYWAGQRLGRLLVGSACTMLLIV
jgi:hypothetical protein